MNRRARRIALRWLVAAAQTKRVSGSGREEYKAAVWDMYERTYRAIGLHIPNAQAMLKYGVWDLEMGSDGKPVAFSLFKKTSFGLKAGLSGFDGSSEGKAVAINNLRTKYKQPGYYGEVSHKVAQIALAAGTPVICSAYVPKVLGKPVEPSADGLHYKRSLGGVGVVEKILVGKPKGVPVTSAKAPDCPMDAGRLAGERGLSKMSMAEHVASLIF